jgi:predicted nucleic acid-binding protein
MIVVDCNVLAHLLLDGTETPRARALIELDADWHSEGFILIELTNVLAAAMRARRLTMNNATIVLAQAQGVIDRSLHGSNPFEVLGLADQFRVSAYDARYLLVAHNLGVKLTTENRKLHIAAPKLTQSLADAVGY